MTTEQGNKLIAEFMGLEKHLSNNWYLIPKNSFDTHNWHEPKFHSSWDWQIPAWKKIIPLIKNILKGNLPADNKRIYLYEQYEFAVMNDDKQAGFEILIQAIQWYNTQTPTP